MTREELLKAGKPILFNTEMVKAILDGRKTCTRRVIKKWSDYDETIPCKTGFWKEFNERDGITYIKDYNFSSSWWPEKEYIKRKSPYQVGDILYVRETFCEVPYEYEHIPMENGHITVPKIAYRADSKIDYTGIWKPSIHMPKELARIFLKVTNVRVERLQDMSIQDMINEGVKASDITTNRGVIEYRVVNRFEELWDSTVKKKDLDKYGFGANPWVWVIEFERVEAE